MEQTKALNALAPFLALTKSASSPRSAADLITRATSTPNAYIFAELLASAPIQSLSQSAEYSSQLTILQIFSYGTYTDYTLTSGLPALNEAQTLKLRQLSLLTLARNPADLSYANLQHKLGLHTTRELEDLVISAIYAGLITATLDPYHQVVTVSSVSPLRDLPPNSIPFMLNTLSEWSTRCVSTLADLEAQIAGIKAEAAKRYKDDKEWEARVEKLIEAAGREETRIEEGQAGGKKLGGMFANIGRRFGGGGAGGGGGNGTGLSSKRGGDAMGAADDEDMDLDDEDEILTERATRSKKRGLGSSFGK